MLFSHRLDQTLLGNDRGNVLSRRHIKSGIVHIHTDRRGLFSEPVSDLRRGTLLDGDFSASGHAEIKRTGRSRDIEWDPMCFRQQRYRIGTDLVRGVSIRGDAVRTNDHGLNLPFLHDPAGHVVAD